jgi:iron complex transport system ATP-binding protein
LSSGEEKWYDNMSIQQEHIISLNNLALGYEGSDMLLSQVNAEVRTGEMVALIGKNGSGKSTLLRTIAALKKPVEGGVLVSNQVNSDIPANRFARMLSFVESGSSPIENLSVYEFVSMGRIPYTNWWGKIKGRDHEKIIEAIGFVNMDAFLEAPVNRLSDGERQRVMIARALAQETSVLLLDEPTAFLDLPNKFEIISVLYKLRDAGKSIIFSTHDLETAFLFADKCWVIHERKLLEGAVEDLGMQDVYSTIFKDTKVQFDESVMKFTPIRLVKGDAYLAPGDSLVTKWTIQALDRIGFTVKDRKSASYPDIEIKNSDGSNQWTVSYQGNSFDFISLYDMAHYLGQIK